MEFESDLKKSAKCVNGGDEYIYDFPICNDITSHDSLLWNTLTILPYFIQHNPSFDQKSMRIAKDGNRNNR
jgi:hypothetical protein